METLFVVLSLIVWRGQTKKSGHSKGSSQFHWYWWVCTLIKYTSFLSIKNVKIVLRIWGKLKGIKVVEVNGPLN